MEYAILFLPLLGSIIGYIGRSLTSYFAEISTSLFVCISAILSILIFLNGYQNNIYGNYLIFEWISSGGFTANWSIKRGSIKFCYVSCSNFCISVSAYLFDWLYATMVHDPHKPRFMSYLSLFTFSMLALVVSDNFLQFFLVGKVLVCAPIY